jgi:hypothetical protein
VVAPVTNVGTVIRLRSTGVPSTVISPGRVSLLSRKISRNCSCSAAGRFVPSTLQARMSNAGGSSPISHCRTR